MIKLILILSVCLATVAVATTGKKPTVEQKPQLRFIDLDGDGINDLAPDTDRDGIPDCLDPDFGKPQGQRRRHWGMFRTMPDSAGTDSIRFQEWWRNSGHPGEWHEGWQRWHQMNERNLHHIMPGRRPGDYGPHNPPPRNDNNPNRPGRRGGGGH